MSDYIRSFFVELVFHFIDATKCFNFFKPIMKNLVFLLCLLSGFAIANPDQPNENHIQPKQVSEEIYKKCLSKAKHIYEEEVCKSKKPAIQQCVENEVKAKDAKSAKTKCELLYLAPSK
ncbi:hypothetical protein [Limnohabitans sp.]|uniref:hypothetical protein n=1 Tax=Limnohabitans sp. TaxID=1907725 RepID=UPI00333FC245